MLVHKRVHHFGHCGVVHAGDGSGDEDEAAEEAKAAREAAVQRILDASQVHDKIRDLRPHMCPATDAPCSKCVLTT